MSGWLFPAFTRPGCGTVSHSTFRISMALQSLVDFSIDFSTLTTALYNPFSDIPEVSEEAEADAGAFSVDGGTFKCSNRLIGTAPNIRMSDLFDYNPFDSRWHLRIEKKNGASWDILFQGIVEPDAQISGEKTTVPEEWVVEFECTDSLLQMDEVTVAAVVSELPHATYDYTPTGVYICYNVSGSPARDQLTLFNMVDKAGDDVNDHRPASELRFFKLVDVIAACSRAMGLSVALNNSAAIDQDWDYIVYDGANDQSKDFSDLYIVSAVYGPSTGPVFQHYFGFFDILKYSDTSFYHCGTALEMLKSILVPHGMTAWVDFTTAGARYLAIGQLQTNNGISFPTYRKGFKYGPADRVIYGITVNVSEAGEYISGSAGDGATGIKCRFISCNRIPATEYENSGSGKFTRDIGALVGGLWALHGTEMHSVYKINVKTYGQSGSSGTGITADYNDRYAGMVVGKAAAAYYFNTIIPTTDPIGINRRLMRRFEFSINGIATSGGPREYVDHNSQKWWTIRRSWDFKNNVTTFVCECGEW